MDEKRRRFYTMEELVVRNMQTMGAVVRYGRYVVVAECSYTGAYEGLLYEATEGGGCMDMLRFVLRSEELYSDSGHAVLWGLNYLRMREREAGVIKDFLEKE